MQPLIPMGLTPTTKNFSSDIRANGRKFRWLISSDSRWLTLFIYHALVRGQFLEFLRKSRPFTYRTGQPQSQNLDQMSALELVDLFNQEDQKTLEAIANAREALAQAIEITSEALMHGGRLFYVGAGTSGRLGVLDAAECPPTFCTPPELVQGIIAGGAGALVRSSEDLEDRAEDGKKAIAQRQITELDVVVGITAGEPLPMSKVP